MSSSRKRFGISRSTIAFINAAVRLGLREGVAFWCPLCRLLRSSSPKNKVPLENEAATANNGRPRFQLAVSRRSCRGTVNSVPHNWIMRKGDIICPECKAGIRRIELSSQQGHAGEFRCPLCDCILEVSDGSTAILYRLTVAPEKLFD